MKWIGKLLGYILLAGNVLVALLLMLSAYSPYFDPHTHPVWSCLGIFFPVLLIPNLLYLAFWLVAYRRYALFPVLVLLLCWGSIRTYFPINLFSDDAPEDAVKILSYNTRAFGLKARHTKEKSNDVLAYLQNCDADIICLQEYIWGNKLKKKDIDYALRDYKYRHYLPLGKGLNGLGIYSRYPILSAIPIKYKSSRNGSVAYRVKVGKDTLLVINNHLESNKILKSDVETYQDMMDAPDGNKVFAGTRKLLHKMAEATAIRAAQADKLLEAVKEAKEKYVVVCGDFNDTPISYTCYTIGRDLHDAYRVSGNGLGRSYNRDAMFVRIDHVFCSSHWEAYEADVVDSVYLSDHHPVVCKLHRKD